MEIKCDHDNPQIEQVLSMDQNSLNLLKKQF